MKGYWESLRPVERRMVVGVLGLFFIVLNFVFVIPHFSDWGRVQFRKAKAEKKLKDYQAEIQMLPTYERQAKQLEDQGGSAVPLEEQANHFQSAIQAQAAQSKVEITGNSRITTSTNSPFFLEQSQSISVQSGEQQLVDFLYNLGSGNSLIRVRDLSVRPDIPARQKLVANVKLVASYQKSQRPGATAPSRTPNPAAKTVTANAK